MVTVMSIFTGRTFEWPGLGNGIKSVKGNQTNSMFSDEGGITHIWWYFTDIS